MEIGYLYLHKVRKLERYAGVSFSFSGVLLASPSQFLSGLFGQLLRGYALGKTWQQGFVNI